jgi:hypothetical protein
MAASDPRVAGSNEGSDKRWATLEGVSELWICSSLWADVCLPPRGWCTPWQEQDKQATPRHRRESLHVIIALNRSRQQL